MEYFPECVDRKSYFRNVTFYILESYKVTKQINKKKAVLITLSVTGIAFLL